MQLAFETKLTKACLKEYIQSSATAPSEDAKPFSWYY